jgi:methyl-accepting chemotaxis protein
MEIAIAALLGVLTGGLAYSKLRKRWLKATTEQRQHHFDVAVDETLKRVLRDEVKSAIHQDMGSIRRDLTDQMGELLVTTKAAVAHAVSDRQRAFANQQQLGDVKAEVGALRTAVQQQTKAAEQMARAVQAQAEATAGLTVVVARFATALGA